MLTHTHTHAHILSLSHSQKPKLSMIEHGHQIDGWSLRAVPFAVSEISPESNSVQILQSSFRWDYKLYNTNRDPRCALCIQLHDTKSMQKDTLTNVKDPVVHVRLRVHGKLDYGNNKITQHKLKLVKMSESSACWNWVLRGRQEDDAIS